MKPGKYAMRITMLVIFFGILAYFGIYIYLSMTSMVELTTVYTSTAEDSAEVSGFIVRDEHVIDEAASTLMEILLDEGEKVAVGGKVAKIYSSEEAVTRQQQIATLETELAQLRILSAGSTSSDAVALEQSIESTLLQIHKETADGSLSTLADDASELETLILQQNYLSEDTQDLETTMTSLANQIATLESYSKGDIRTVTASVSGTYSGYVDGYESILTVDALEGLTPQTLESWEKLSATVAAEQYIGKLIAGQTWYYAATMDAEEAARMGSTVTLRFTSGFTDSITMTVESISDEVDGKVAVVFSSIEYLTQTTTMRYQAADIVYDRISGIEIPLSALRIQTTTNEDGSSTSEMGVYVLVGTRVEWKSVTVLYTGDDYCLVKATDSTDSNALRSGDQVVSKGKNIYSGRVISELDTGG